MASAVPLRPCDKGIPGKDDHVKLVVRLESGLLRIQTRSQPIQTAEVRTFKEVYLPSIDFVGRLRTVGDDMALNFAKGH